MITCTLTPLPAERDRELRLWLGKPEVELLKKVALAKEQKYECEALKEAVQSKEFPDKMAAANATFTRAHRYSNFLQVLNEIIEQRDPYQGAKLT